MLILRIFVVFDQFFIHFVRVAAKVEQCLYDQKKTTLVDPYSKNFQGF